MLHILSTSVLPLLLFVAAASDVVSLRIPNWLTGLTALLFFPMAVATAMPLHDFGLHLAAGMGLFVAGFLFFQLGLFGGGDAKLLAAAGLWLGPSLTVQFLFVTAMAGGILALLVLLWSMFNIFWELEAKGKFTQNLGQKLRAIKPNVPYGVALAVGGIFAFKDSWWMAAIA